MTIERSVMWLEGAFLRPQHFQQQDRRAASALSERASMAQPFHWGFSQLEIDETRLRQCEVALRACRGAFQDGTPFGWPGEIATPPSIRPPRDCTNAIVYLRLPEAAPGARLALPVADGQFGGTRYAIEPQDLTDVLDTARSAEPVETGALNASLGIGPESREGYLTIPVAKILEIDDDNAVRLDPDFIPTVVHAGAAPALGGIVGEISALLAARADALAGNSSQVGAQGNAALVELMLLQLANAQGAVFAELAAANVHHPETLYRACLELAGSLRSFSTAGSRRAPAFPSYDHDEITPCFTAVVAVIRGALAEVVDPDAYLIPLTSWDAGGFYGVITPPDLLPDGRFVIVARAALEETAFRESFPRQVTIASINQVQDYVTRQDRGVRLEPLSVVPSELRPQTGWTYFQLRPDRQCWLDIVESQAIAIYEANAFPDLKLELWGIRSGR